MISKSHKGNLNSIVAGGALVLSSFAFTGEAKAASLLDGIISPPNRSDKQDQLIGGLATAAAVDSLALSTLVAFSYRKDRDNDPK